VRVCLIAPPWIAVPPPAYGGTEAVIDTLARGLQADGHEVVVFTTGDSRSEVPIAWVHPEALGTTGRMPAAELHHVTAGHRFARAWGADVVHDHTLFGPAVSAGRPGPPVVTTAHDPILGDHAEVYRHLAREVPLIAISRSQASAAEGVPIAAVIHHGIDVPDPAPEHPVRSPAGMARAGERSPDAPVAFLGRMTPDKGVHVALEVAAAAGVEIVVAGKCREPDEIAYFDAMVRPRLGHRAHYLGEVGPTDRHHLLGSARCLLNPIQWPEPFGMVMIEALAVGTPVVTTPNGAAPEIVEHGVTGFVCRGVAELVEAVGRTRELSPWRCTDSVRSRFSSRRMTARHSALYETIIEPTRDDGVAAGPLLAS